MIMFKNIFLLLVLVHILGDYYLQTDRLSKMKDESFYGLAMHSIIYLGCNLLLCIIITNDWIIKVSIINSLMHFTFDYIKYCYLKKLNDIHSKDKESIVYIVDQVLHIIGFIFISLIIAKKYNQFNTNIILDEIFSLMEISSRQLFLWVLMILLIDKPANITIKKLLFSYRPEIAEKENNLITVEELEINLESEKALANGKSESALTNDVSKNEIVSAEKRAGALIGFLERFIIAIFLSINQYSAIGLVLTAKSIARYDKISKSQEFAEYYLLGTLLSTLIVISVYLILM